jgi:hypothetical protein
MFDAERLGNSLLPDFKIGKRFSRDGHSNSNFEVQQQLTELQFDRLSKLFSMMSQFFIEIMERFDSPKTILRTLIQQVKFP